MAAMDNLPPPSLQGDYRGSCVVCLKGTDTALASTGEAEWHMGVLAALGVPQDQAETTLRAALRESGWQGTDDEVPDGVFTHGIRVCAECVSKSEAGFPAPGLLAFGVPNIAPRST